MTRIQPNRFLLQNLWCSATVGYPLSELNTLTSPSNHMCSYSQLNTPAFLQQASSARQSKTLQNFGDLQQLQILFQCMAFPHNIRTGSCSIVAQFPSMVAQFSLEQGNGFLRYKVSGNTALHCKQCIPSLWQLQTQASISQVKKNSNFEWSTLNRYSYISLFWISNIL